MLTLRFLAAAKFRAHHSAYLQPSMQPSYWCMKSKFLYILHHSSLVERMFLQPHIHSLSIGELVVYCWLISLSKSRESRSGGTVDE